MRSGPVSSPGQKSGPPSGPPSGVSPKKRPIPVLHTERLLLTLPAPSMAKEHLLFAQENADHLGPWEPPIPSDYFTLRFWRERLQRNVAELEQETSLRLSIFWKRDPQSPVLGNCNFGSFIWGAFHCATLGYRLDHRVVGQGVMTEALRCAIRYMFVEMGFHRIQANYRPTNERSAAVLRRLGFVVEGYARDYLFIDGAWRDHILTSLTNPDMPGHPPRLPK